MTPQEQQLLVFIGDHIRSHGYSPTYAKMAEHLGVKSKSGAFSFVENLIWQGKLRRGRTGRMGSLYLVNPLENVSSDALRFELARRGEPTA
jgi:SOS-response transcriptional repressor LexA